ncbi:hypothetical protein JCM8202_004513, partial [Rhodotorula sphaerocarpa]
ATLYYQDEIESTTRRLQADLHRLSDQLVRSAPPARGGAIQVDSAAAPVIPQRIPFSEELKARWNEQVGSALYAAQTTDWSSVASRTFSKLRATLSAAPQTADAVAGAASSSPAPLAASSGTPADEAAGSLTSVGASAPPAANAGVKAQSIPSQADAGKRWV